MMLERHPMVVLRRSLVIAAIAFWQGGFTFYAGVVVPIGQDVLGSAREQGFITRHVTRYLNLAGLAALAILAWDVIAARDPNRWRRWARRLTWAGMVLALAALAWLHPQLDQLLEPATGSIRDRMRFRTEHRWYLWISTVQWALALLYTITSVASWRKGDMRIVRGKEAEAQKKCPADEFLGVAQSPKSSCSGTTE